MIHYSDMVNLFPVLFLALLGHAVLRIFLGMALVYLGYSHFRKNRIPLTNALIAGWPFLGRFSKVMAFELAFVEVVMGLMFIVGAFTQVAALVGMIVSFKMLIFKRKIAYPIVPSPLFWVLVFGTCVSLFVTGAGAFAFDFPI